MYTEFQVFLAFLHVSSSHNFLVQKFEKKIIITW